jgi:positive phototaxis protein PixI
LNLADRQAHLSSPVVEPVTPAQQQFLRFVLPSGLMALIEIDAAVTQLRQQVTELVNISLDRVVPMPHLPPAVRGVYNWRGEVLWIVDLAILMGIAGISRRYRSLQPTIILTSSPSLEAGGSRDRLAVGVDADEDRQARTLGLIVDEIVEIEWYQLDLIRAPRSGEIPPALSKWVRSVWESVTGEHLLVLDGRAIFECAEFHAEV